MRIVFVISLLAGPLWATDCPAPPDHSAALEVLFKRAQSAKSEQMGRVMSDQMWLLWTDAPNPKAQALLDQGMARREGFDFAGAYEALNALVAYCPTYAEGWNQRAFVHFLRQDYQAASADLAKAHALNPKHLGVLTGQAHTFIALGQEAAAQDALAAAIELNPWIGERHLLRPVGEKPGQAL